MKVVRRPQFTSAATPHFRLASLRHSSEQPVRDSQLRSAGLAFPGSSQWGTSLDTQAGEP